MVRARTDAILCARTCFHYRYGRHGEDDHSGSCREDDSGSHAIRTGRTSLERLAVAGLSRCHLLHNARAVGHRRHNRCIPEGRGRRPIDSAGIYANIDQDSVTKLIAEISDKGLPDLQVVYFPGIDLYTHLSSDPLTQQLEYLETVTDPSIGGVLDTYEKLGALNDTYVILIADHGHTPVLNDAQHALGTTSENTPTALMARAGFRLRPLLLIPPADQQDYQAVVAYQGAMAFIYLADRSTCASIGSRCDWSRPPRFRQDVRPILRAFYKVNQSGRPIPQLQRTLDLIFSREPAPLGSNALPFKVFDGTKLIPIPEYLAKHPRPDLIDLDQRMQWLGSGPYGNRAGDIVLLARTGMNRSLADRYYFSGPYHSWHGSASEQGSHVPFIL